MLQIWGYLLIKGEEASCFSLYKGVEVKCQIQENQKVVTIPESVCTYVLLADRWCKYRETILGIMKRLSDCE